MSIQGNIHTMELSELLQWLSQSRKTGTLLIHRGAEEKKVFFEEGRVVSSAANDPKEFLGHFLVSHDLIDEDTLAKAMELQEERKMLLGKILVTIGAITEEKLEEVLRLKAEECIYDLFTWTEGDFRFVDEELPEYTMIPIRLDVTGLVLEGTRRLDDWKRIRKRITSLQAVPVAVGELKAPEDAAGAKKLLDLVDDDRTIEEIALQAHASEFLVCRTLYDQLTQGRLKLVRPRVADGTPEAVVTTDSVSASTLVRNAQDLLSKGEFSESLRHLRAARSLEPDSSSIQAAIEGAEARIRESIEHAGITLDALPVLTCDLKEVASLQLSSREGFILTRINGSFDVQTLLKISPMPPLDAQVVIWRLLVAGMISLGQEAEPGEEDVAHQG